MWINAEKTVLPLSFASRLVAVSGRTHHKVGRAMDRETARQADPVEEILTFDIPDDALERAASAEPNALTWIPCTHLPYDCIFPL
jgi:hypothetical protein